MKSSFAPVPANTVLSPVRELRIASRAGFDCTKGFVTGTVKSMSALPGGSVEFSPVGAGLGASRVSEL